MKLEMLNEKQIRDGLTWGELLQVIFVWERIKNKPDLRHLECDRLIFQQSTDDLFVMVFPQSGFSQILRKGDKKEFLQHWTNHEGAEFIVIKRNELTSVKIEAERAKQYLGLI